MTIDPKTIQPGDKFTVEFECIRVMHNDGVSIYGLGGSQGARLGPWRFSGDDIVSVERPAEPLKVGDRVRRRGFYDVGPYEIIAIYGHLAWMEHCEDKFMVTEDLSDLERIP